MTTEHSEPTNPSAPPPLPPHAVEVVKQGQRIGNRYVIQERLGAGGMGVVYRAIEDEIEREVALKFILPNPSLSTEERDAYYARFRQEAQALGSLPPHPNRVVLYQYGQQDHLHFMSMELVRGRSLSEVMREGLSAQQIVSYTRQMARALVDVHASGIVHRDLKPENLIVTRNLLGDEQLKLIDFGIARAPVRLDDRPQQPVEDEAEEDEILGTVLYMAPELLLDGIQDPRTDIYAIGVILFELITGQSPFAHAAADSEPADVIEVMRQHVEVEPGPLTPRQGVGELPKGFEPIVRRCLAKKPEDRFADASELLRSLDQVRRPRLGRGGTGQYRPMNRQQAQEALEDAEEEVGLRADVRLVPSKDTGARVATTAICGVSRRVAAADVAGDTRVWDYDNGTEVLYIPSPQRDEHTSVQRTRLAFSPNGSLLALGDRAGKLWLVDVSLQTRDPIPLSQGGPLALAFDKAATLMVVATTAGTLELWDVPDRRQLASLTIELPKADLGADRWSLLSLALSPRRHCLAAGTDAGVVYVWNFTDRSRSGPLRSPPPLPGEDSDTSAPAAAINLAFSPDDDRLAVLRGSKEVEIWDPKRRTRLQRVRLSKKGNFRRVAFSPDGSQLLVTGDEGAIAMVDAESGEVLETIRIPRGNAVNLSFTRDDVPMASLGSGSTVQVWDLLRLGRVRTLGPYPTRLLDVTIAPYGDTALTLSAGGQIDRWDLCTGRHLGRQELGTRTLRELHKAPETNRLLTCGPREGLVALEGVGHNSAAPLKRVPLPVPGPEVGERVITYTISPDDRLVALGYQSGEVRVYSYKEPGEPAVLEGTGKTISTLTFSPDGHHLAVADEAGRVRLWDVLAGEVIWEEHSGRLPVRMMAFTPSGRLLSIPRGHNIEIWNLERKRRVARLLGHDGAIQTLVYGLDGRLLLTASDDGTARLWDVAQQRTLRSLVDHPGPVTAATLDPQLRFLLTTSGPYLSIWRLRDAELLGRLAYCGQEQGVEDGTPGRDHWLAFTAEGYFTASVPQPPNTLMTRPGTRVRISDAEREALFDPRAVAKILTLT